MVLYRAWVTCGVNRKSVTLLSHVSILSRILIRFSRLLSARNRLIGIETGLFYLIFLISFVACRTCSPYIARVSRSKSASQCWREKRKKKKKIGPCSAVYFFYRHLIVIDRLWNKCIFYLSATKGPQWRVTWFQIMAGLLRRSCWAKVCRLA